MWTAALVIFALVLVNAFYVSAEFSAVSVRPSRMRQLAEEGNRIAARLLPILEQPKTLDSYVAACQIGITWSSLVAGAYGQATIGPALQPLIQEFAGVQTLTAASIAAAVTLVLISALQIILGELVPKSVALQYPDNVAFYTYFPMRWSMAAYSWFLKVLNGSGMVVLRLLGFRETSHRHIHSPDEIDLLILESRKGGLLEPEEHERLHRALRLASRKVRQLMVPRVHMAAIPIDASPEDILRTVTGTKYTRLPVYQGSPANVIGMLHTKELALYAVEHGRIPRVADVLRPVGSIHEAATGDRLLSAFREKRSHQMTVVDEHGVVGLVTLGDLMAEVLGQDSAEFRIGQPRPERLASGRVRLPGLMALDEVEQWIGVPWRGRSDTIGGLITSTLGRVPRPGERVGISGVDVEIERVVNNAVFSVLATPAAPAGRSQS
ncbi:MAG TPA: hemolysin family protein [Bryobacteraceae bacterium]|nr:hemolysin family protein [Bryobacteraceae bacterium]